MTNFRSYRYIKGEDPALDADFSSAAAYEKLLLGRSALFWKAGLRWHCVSLDQVSRIFRRVEPVHGKLCCGGQSFLIQWLVVRLHDGQELVLHIGDSIVGDSVRAQAEALLESLKLSHPHIQYGKA